MAQRLQLLASAAVLAYIGMLIVTALYYLFFEVNPTMTRLWHEAVSNSTIRHDIRDVGEGLLGGLLAQMIIWNHYKKKVQKRAGLLDKLEIKLHVPSPKDDRRLSVWQLLASPILVALYAVPGFLIAFWIASWAHHSARQFNVVIEPPHSSLGQKFIHTWTTDWDKKLIGYSAAFFWGRRPAKGIFDDVQLMFVERRISNKQPLRWYHLPTFKARYNDVSSSVRFQQFTHSAGLKTFVIASVPVGLALAGFGWYVLSYIAK